MVQLIVIAILFLGAALFLGRLVWRSFQAKSGCASNCGKCSTVADELSNRTVKS